VIRNRFLLLCIRGWVRWVQQNAPGSTLSPWIGRTQDGFNVNGRFQDLLVYNKTLR
jgi:hypothetical protein